MFLLKSIEETIFGKNRGKWGNAGQGLVPDNAVVANRAMMAIFHYLVAIVT